MESPEVKTASTLVSGWFGPQFAALHPLLQQMHRTGGVLEGEIELGFGRGLAGWMGQRIAHRMGLPQEAGTLPFRVDISHDEQALVWARQFGGARPREMVSRFEPSGRWPGGRWQEKTGALQLALTVDVPTDGSWHWRLLGARLHGIPVPVALIPRSHAFKRVEPDGTYRFEVAFVVPGLGRALWYGGNLRPHVDAP